MINKLSICSILYENNGLQPAKMFHKKELAWFDRYKFIIKNGRRLVLIEEGWGIYNEIRLAHQANIIDFKRREIEAHFKFKQLMRHYLRFVKQGLTNVEWVQFRSRKLVKLRYLALGALRFFRKFRKAFAIQRLASTGLGLVLGRYKYFKKRHAPWWFKVQKPKYYYHRRLVRKMVWAADSHRDSTYAAYCRYGVLRPRKHFAYVKKLRSQFLNSQLLVNHKQYKLVNAYKYGYWPYHYHRAYVLKYREFLEHKKRDFKLKLYYQYFFKRYRIKRQYLRHVQKYNYFYKRLRELYRVIGGRIKYKLKTQQGACVRARYVHFRHFVRSRYKLRKMKIILRYILPYLYGTIKLNRILFQITKRFCY